MIRHRRRLVCVALATPLALLALALDATAGVAPSTVVVGGAPLALAGATTLGGVAPGTRLALTVVLQSRDPAGLAALASAVSTTGSPSYHHYLTVPQFAARFGAGPAAVATVRRILRSEGLRPGALARNGLSIAVTASAARASRAFGVRLRRYRRSGLQLYSNTTAPRVPASLGGLVTDVLGLNDVPASAPAGLVRVAPTPGPRSSATPLARAAAGPFPGGGGPVPCAAAHNFESANPRWFTIDQIARAYRIDGLYGAGDFGQGVTVALLELDPYAAQPVEQTDVAQFQACFGTHATVSETPVDGGATPPASPTAESAVDIENVIGLAPAANVEVYDGPNSDNGRYLTLAAIVEQDNAQVISDSWGLCELANGADKGVAIAESNLLYEAALQHESFLASSGDRGAEGCATQWNNNLNDAAAQGVPNASALAVDDPASQPYATAVGGTNLTALGPPPSESAWDHLFWGASGGGISTFWGMPGYQLYAGVPGVVNSYSSRTPCGQASGYCREVPDVSADGSTETAYVTYYQGAWTAFGGTSTSAPVWAALIALADASGIDGCTPATPLGFLNPLLYEVAAGDNHATAFNDITTGENSGYFNGSVPFGAYPATPGYDMTSGLGTPIATDGSSPGLVQQLCDANSTPLGAPATVSSLSAAEAATGATITINGSGFTPYAAVWFGSTVATAVSEISPTQLLATVPPGSGAVHVTVTKLAGWSSPTAADLFTYAPTATISSPSAAATYTQGQPVTASYSCSGSGPPACNAPIANGAPIDTSTLGPGHLSVTATDSNNFATTTTAAYNVVAPPAIAVSGLTGGATYVQGQALSAQVTCSTSAPVTITSCSAPGTVDTGAPGTHSFSVAATDSNGVTTTQVISYTVVSAPGATIQTPSNGATYLRGAKVAAAFSCTAVAPAHVASCIATAANGAPISTTTIGAHRFTLTATDSSGASTTVSASYNVVAARPRLSGLHQTTSKWIEHHRAGAVLPVGTRFLFSLDQPARVTFSFARSAAGRLAAGRCVSPTAAVAKAPPCVRSVGSGTLTLAAAPGANVLVFAGQTSIGALPPGDYTVIVAARGVSGRPSKPLSLQFRIATPRR